MTNEFIGRLSHNYGGRSKSYGIVKGMRPPSNQENIVQQVTLDGRTSFISSKISPAQAMVKGKNFSHMGLTNTVLAPSREELPSIHPNNNQQRRELQSHYQRLISAHTQSENSPHKTAQKNMVYRKNIILQSDKNIYNINDMQRHSHAAAAVGEVPIKI